MREMLAIGSGRKSWGEEILGEGEKAHLSGPRADLGIEKGLNKLWRAGVEREGSMVSI